MITIRIKTHSSLAAIFLGWGDPHVCWQEHTICYNLVYLYFSLLEFTSSVSSLSASATVPLCRLITWHRRTLGYSPGDGVHARMTRPMHPVPDLLMWEELQTTETITVRQELFIMDRRKFPLQLRGRVIPPYPPPRSTPAFAKKLS